MATREAVEKVISEMIAPRLRADGGDIQLVDVDAAGTVKVKLKGACAGCPGARMTLKMAVERILKQQLEGIQEVVAV
jgi:Fe-S cluster biogenesis protein NfuA